MPRVRILSDWRGYKCGEFAVLTRAEIAAGESIGAVDAKAVHPDDIALQAKLAEDKAAADKAAAARAAAEQAAADKAAAEKAAADKATADKLAAEKAAGGSSSTPPGGA